MHAVRAKQKCRTAPKQKLPVDVEISFEVSFVSIMKESLQIKTVEDNVKGFTNHTETEDYLFSKTILF